MSIRKVTKVLDGMCEQLDPEAQVIFGARVDPSYRDLIRVMAVITGIQAVPELKGRRSREREELADTIGELVEGGHKRRSGR